jgi:hypothetical protein
MNNGGRDRKPPKKRRMTLKVGGGLIRPDRPLPPHPVLKVLERDPQEDPPEEKKEEHEPDRH